LVYSDLVWSGEYKTREDIDRDYNVTATAGQLFDFGIEEEITIDIAVDDLAPVINSSTFSQYVFNVPKDPIVSNAAPTD